MCDEKRRTHSTSMIFLRTWTYIRILSFPIVKSVAVRKKPPLPLRSTYNSLENECSNNFYFDQKRKHIVRKEIINYTWTYSRYVITRNFSSLRSSSLVAKLTWTSIRRSGLLPLACPTMHVAKLASNSCTHTLHFEITWFS